MMLVSSYGPAASWAGEFYQAERKLAQRRPSLEPVGEHPPAVRPDCHMPPSSGHLGPGSHTCSDALTRRTMVCPKFLKSQRFQPVSKEESSASRLPRGLGECMSPTARAQPDEPDRPGRPPLPMCNPGLKLGRAGPKEVSYVPPSDDGLSCGPSSGELATRSFRSGRRSASLPGYPRCSDAITFPQTKLRHAASEAKPLVAEVSFTMDEFKCVAIVDKRRGSKKRGSIAKVPR
mmetsp:Transcript_72975/g.237253  ORF Transcript_72975/g.237253 Transcript_72975/m.237253 type:complete len:233 (-) Transcript_72975:78-776(-)